MPVIRSSTQTPRRSPRKHRSALQPAPAPLTPPVANTDRPHEDLLQKVTQVLEFFEREVARAQEEKQAAVDACVAAEKAEADAKVAEEVICKKVRKVDIRQCLPVHTPTTCYSSVPSTPEQRSVTCA
ncbi:hypothetical protein BKA83DRAFT_4125811 [Pisolithus microcarpus]|nr:hypothetical protein BKA83DRAFT_4125811 [Pisolithus microcarpus]